jgi:ketosteroid isomerase-like protein
MTDDLLERIRGGYGAWNEDDLEQTLDFLDPEVEWRTSASFPGVEPLYRGHDGFRRFWQHLHEPWEDVHLTIESYQRAEDMALVRLRFHGRSKLSGVEVDLPWFQVLRIEDERVVASALDRTAHDALDALDASHLWSDF